MEPIACGSVLLDAGSAALTVMMPVVLAAVAVPCLTSLEVLYMHHVDWRVEGFVVHQLVIAVGPCSVIHHQRGKIHVRRTEREHVITRDT
jgi:hypothetical protein